MLMTLLLLAVITIGSVSAADDLAGTDEGILKENPSDNMVLNENSDEKVIALSQDNIISANDDGTFTALKNKIDNAENKSTIILENDYAYDDEFGKAWGIEVNKEITIDGNGHTIDGMSKARMFEFNQAVTLKNINFVNGFYKINYYEGGGAIFNSADCTLISCNFINCSSNFGGVILNGGGSHSKITSCNFVDCFNAVYNNPVSADLYCEIDSCNFINCTAVSGGAISNVYPEGSSNAHIPYCNVTSCNFVNCTASRTGGAIYNVNTWAGSYGDRYRVTNSHIISCNFIGCTSDDNYGGAISNAYKNGSYVFKCTFFDYYKRTDAVDNNTDLTACTFKDASKKDIDYFNNLFKIDPVTIDPKITAKDTIVVYASNGKYSVTVYGTDGNVAKAVSVTFKIKGNVVYRTNTNANGVAAYIVKEVPGNYKITATALGKSVTNILSVKHLVALKTVTVKKSAKSLTLQVTLGKVGGKYLKSKQITFKFNGKTYKAKTNSKGVAKVTIKSSVLKKLKVGKSVAYQATYLKDTVKKTAIVKK